MKHNNNNRKNAIPPAMQAMFDKAATTIAKTQSQPAPRADRIQSKVLFLGYTVFNSVTKHNERLDEPPEVQEREIKSGPRKGQRIPGDLEMQCRIESLSTVPGQCEPLPDGSGWEVRGEVGYSNMGGIDTAAWLVQNALTYQGSFPIGEYVKPLPEPHCVEHKEKIVVRKGSIWKFKTPNLAKLADNPFRQLNADGSFKIKPRTPIIFNQNELSLWVMLRGGGAEGGADAAPGGAPQEGAASQEGAAPQAPAGGANATGGPTPQVYMSFKAKWASISSDHDPTLPESELIHAQENRDAHVLVPVSTLKAGMQFTPYFWAANYSTPPPGVGPHRMGVTTWRAATGNAGDFSKTVKNKKTDLEERIGQFRACFHAVNWRDQPESENSQLYGVKLISTDDSGLWRRFLIHDLDHYEDIMLANQDLPFHADCSTSVANVIANPANSAVELDKIHAIEGMEKFQGFYDMYIRMLVPDFLRYFVTSGLRISRARVELEFKQGKSFDGDHALIGLMLRPRPDADPIEQRVTAPVIALGNGLTAKPTEAVKRPPMLYNAFDGDILPLLDSCDFFVLSSRAWVSDDERAKYCGYYSAMSSEAQRDAFFSSEIADPEKKIRYWIYAAKRSVLMQVAKTMGEDMMAGVDVGEGGPSAEGGGTKRPAPTEEAAEGAAADAAATEAAPAAPKAKSSRKGQAK